MNEVCGLHTSGRCISQPHLASLCHTANQHSRYFVLSRVTVNNRPRGCGLAKECHFVLTRMLEQDVDYGKQYLSFTKKRKLNEWFVRLNSLRVLF